MISYYMNNIPIRHANMGYTGKQDVATSLLQITNSNDILSVIWIGKTLDIEIYKLIQLTNDHLYFRNTIKIKNIGKNTLTEVGCK